MNFLIILYSSVRQIYINNVSSVNAIYEYNFSKQTLTSTFLLSCYFDVMIILPDQAPINEPSVVMVCPRTSMHLMLSAGSYFVFVLCFLTKCKTHFSSPARIRCKIKWLKFQVKIIFVMEEPCVRISNESA